MNSHELLSKKHLKVDFGGFRRIHMILEEKLLSFVQFNGSNAHAHEYGITGKK